MGVVSFRLTDEDEKRLRRAGISPGAKAKEVLEAEARKLAFDESEAYLAKHRRRATIPVQQLIREIRDEH